ncbi:MAG: ACT domain-containing protein [Candidatus Hydrothermarchaeota archaeon]
MADGGADKEIVVITIMGEDRPGIVAGISAVLAKNDVNIEDISQTVVGGIFTMILLADVKKSKSSLEELRRKLERRGRSLGMQVLVQHERIFQYMHRV